MPPILINWNRHKWGLHSIVDEVQRWLLYFSYHRYQEPISIHHMVSLIHLMVLISSHLHFWVNLHIVSHLPWLAWFCSIVQPQRVHIRMHTVCFLTKTSHSLHMEKAENWSHYSLKQLKTMLAKGSEENTVISWLETQQVKHWPTDSTGRVYPSNSHCVV